MEQFARNVPYGEEESHRGLVRAACSRFVQNFKFANAEILVTNRNPAYGGGLAERLKAHAWKACGRNPSQVRILYPPPWAGESVQPFIGFVGSSNFVQIPDLVTKSRVLDIAHAISGESPPFRRQHFLLACRSFSACGSRDRLSRGDCETGLLLSFMIIYYE